MTPDPFAGRVVRTLVLGGIVALLVSLIGAPWPLPLGAPLVAHAAGLVAGYQAAVMLVLMARVPLLDRRIGPDRLARWHSRSGRVFIVLVLVHAVATVSAWSTVRGIDPFNAIIEVLGMPGLLTATLATALLVFIAVGSVRRARRRLSFERWHTVHLLSYVAIVSAFSHQLADPNLAGHRGVQIAWGLLYGWSLALVMRYRVLGPLLGMWRHRLRVVDVRPEADGVVSILMRGHGLGELAAQPGQFFRWRFLAGSTWRTAHPFSLSAPPSDDFFRITVKALGPGSRLAQRVRPGTLVLAEGPSGAMTAEQRTRSSVLLIAGGIGITPMRTLFETLEAPPGRLTLLYRTSGPADVVFGREIESIAGLRGAEVRWLIGSSRDPANAMTAENLRRWVPDVTGRDIYLCAGPGLATAVKGALDELGVPRRQIYDESFAF